jgi:hypothetical protein
VNSGVSPNAENKLLVTLNLFQGPSCGKLRAGRIGANRGAYSGKLHSDHAEQWVLKHVQDDVKNRVSLVKREACR